MFLKKSTDLLNVPDDFIQLAVSGMSHLKRCGRSNVIYSLVKTVGTMRPDHSDSLLPADGPNRALCQLFLFNFYKSGKPVLIKVCNIIIKLLICL